VKLSNLDSNNTLEGTADITHKNQTFQLEYAFLLREPLSRGKKKYEVFTLLKLYPKFEVEDGVADFVA
jgi:hypothetical protein